MMMMGFGVFGLLFMFFFLILIIVVAVAIISWLFPNPLSTSTQTKSISRPPYSLTSDKNTQITASGRNETALEILKRRYALGELTKEEFEIMKKDILL